MCDMQGRIQELMLGVAQMDNFKKKKGGGVMNIFQIRLLLYIDIIYYDIIIVYIYI